MEPALIPNRLESLDEFLAAGPYVGYVYSYPHKTAYRELAQPRRLGEVWAGEANDARFLYLHVPFCEMRCGFCNLFTLSQPDGALPEAYLHAIDRHARAILAEAPTNRFSRLAIGGGTPTFLDARQLDSLFEVVARLGVDPSDLPTSIETSPTTIDAQKARQLSQLGVDRISMGVQSFDVADVGKMGRSQRRRDVEAAIETIRNEPFSTLNLDLIYGGEGQTLASWGETLTTTISYRPEEIYIYPLYVRPLTGLAPQARNSREQDSRDLRPELYRAAREKLLAEGYEQVSMRMFQLPGTGLEGPAYCCQEDGMIGLGCGARSYTRELHYADTFAVRQSAVRNIIEDYIKQDDSDWRYASRGIELSAHEQRRRYMLISLLNAEGLSLPAYVGRFQTAVCDDFPQLSELFKRGLATTAADRLFLTESGLANSDAIGPWLYSQDVRRRMESFPWQ